jgi:membrane fusion protein (multidrug efflux system)
MTPRTETKNGKTSNSVLVLLSVVLIASALLGWHFVVHPHEVNTDDAQIDGHVHPINSRIGGTITWVNPNVEDTYYVTAGTVMAHLDPNDYQPTVNRLEGDLQASEAQERAAALNLPIASATALSRLGSAQASLAEADADLKTAISQKTAADATVTQAEANYRRAEDDRVRYQALVATHEISLSEYDQRATDAKSTGALLAAAQANSAVADQRIEAARQKIIERQSDLRLAETAPQSIASARANMQRAAGETKRSQATLWNAQLDLGYTDLVAPVSGIVGRKSMEVGQRVAANQLMLTLAPPKDVWAIANFRETQLKKMRIGQPARVHVDSIGQDFEGTVESIGGATGSKYSVIAPENATGNYVKVVQRIPVRIRLNGLESASPLLLPGMSIEVSVRVDP